MFFFLQRRKARSSVHSDAPPVYSRDKNPAEKSVRIGSNGVIMEGYDQSASKRPLELSAFVLPVEMPNDGRPVELPATAIRGS
jgi:hypothetical protein